ncbi:MAG: carbonic anhydrase [Leptonema sp. (in: bacteria)]
MDSIIIDKLLKGNQEFIKEALEKDSNFFKKLANIQNPEYLWIGCSDSRIPADKITNQMPGTIFVHRNIANQINPIDFNVLSVIYFSLFTLGIQNIIICGHYNCGGINASILLAENKRSYGFLDNWLLPIKELYLTLKEKKIEFRNFDVQDFDKISKALSEINVLKQMEVFENLTIVQQYLRESKKKLNLIGMIYDVKDGKLNLLQIKEIKNEI